MKDRVIPDAKEALQSDPFGWCTVAVPVEEAVAGSFDHRPSDKKSKEQKRRRQKEDAGPRQVLTGKALQPSPHVWLAAHRILNNSHLIFLPGPLDCLRSLFRGCVPRGKVRGH